MLLLSGLNPQALIKGMDGDAPEILYGADGMVEVGLGGSCNTHFELLAMTLFKTPSCVLLSQ